MKPRVLLIDNIDSFVFNLAQAFEVLGAEVLVHRNDALSVPEALALQPTHLVVSPGPGRPEAAGVSEALIAACLGRVPVLGVCLGHQALCQVLGARVQPAARLVHGEAEVLRHDGRGLFEGLEGPVTVGRYHSLAVDPGSLPSSLEASAFAQDGELMAVRHRTLPVVGLQFHPESVLSPRGPQILGRFLALRSPIDSQEAA